MEVHFHEKRVFVAKRVFVDKTRFLSFWIEIDKIHSLYPFVHTLYPLSIKILIFKNAWNHEEVDPHA